MALNEFMSLKFHFYQSSNLLCHTTLSYNFISIIIPTKLSVHIELTKIIDVLKHDFRPEVLRVKMFHSMPCTRVLGL